MFLMEQSHLEETTKATHYLLGLVHLDIAGVRALTTREQHLMGDLIDWYREHGPKHG